LTNNKKKPIQQTQATDQCSSVAADNLQACVNCSSYANKRGLRSQTGRGIRRVLRRAISLWLAKAVSGPR